MADTLYLKIEKNVSVDGGPLRLRDIAEVSCSTAGIENRVKALRFPPERIEKPGRYAFSVLDVIRVIQKDFPSLEINNLGEADFIVTVERQNTISEFGDWMKTVAVCVLTFFGASFSIMAFNNDIGITTLFGQLYRSFTGVESDGFTVLEISYSIGVGLGILIFFHHFARKKKGDDPTPLEVEMRTYEEEVDDTLIAAGKRKQGTG